MKHIRTATIGCAVLAVAAVLAWQRPWSQAAAPAADTPAPPSRPLPGTSLYQLRAIWTTDDDRRISLAQLGGRVEILVLMFTECQGTCPVLVKQLQMFAAGMPRDVARDAHFVLVSIDNEHDTTEQLRRYRQAMRLPPERWTLLTGEGDDVRELAAVLGFNYDAVEPERFVHSNLITVLSPLGEIVHQQAGVGGEMGALVAAIRANTR